MFPGTMASPVPVQSVLSRRLVFVSGKGGVGKTVVSLALARSLARSGAKTLWVEFENPTRPAGELVHPEPRLTDLNCEASLAFEEYAGMKLGSGTLTRIFAHNKLIQYLAKAAPGIHELVLLGKIWHERLNFDAVICDMPSTGYGLTMFQSTMNFARLFHGSPIQKDANAMLETFHDSREAGHLIVALPEEMPLQEGLELGEHLAELFPNNGPAYLVNRLFPRVTTDEELPEAWPKPLADSPEDYARKRSILENHNLRLWRERKIPFSELSYVPPGQNVIETLATSIRAFRSQTT